MQILYKNIHLLYVCSDIRPVRRWPRHARVCGVHAVRVCAVCTQVFVCAVCTRVSARECAYVRMYVRAGGACADVRVQVYLVEYVYYKTSFDIF